MTFNNALEPTAASALRRLAVPSSLRSSAAAQPTVGYALPIGPAKDSTVRNRPI